jgi:hypothetical protein
MIACQIKDVKQFMNILLNSETFDKFCLEEGHLVTAYTLDIDGRTVFDYYTGAEDAPQELSEFISWRDIRPTIFAQMKGKRTPVAFRFTLHADKDYTMRLIQKHALNFDCSTVKCLLVNIRYEHGTLNCITGTAFTTFVADQSLEQLWDATFKKSLDSLHINFEVQ